MKNLMILILGVIISVNVSAQINKRIVKLSGSINDKYAILMTLAIEGDSITGFYFYDKYKTKILLEGQIHEGKVVLKESPGYESDFEIGFVGNLNDSSFTGVWKDKTQNKTMKFNTLIYSDYLPDQDENLLNIEGRFESILNSEKYNGLVVIKHIADKDFCFEISNGTESGCVGYLKGLLELADLKNGIYSGVNCEELLFTFANKELNLNEDNCDFHGARCPFSGKYIKK